MVVADSVNIRQDVRHPANGNRYIAVTNQGFTKFHALDLKLTNVTLRTNEAGIYYKATMDCDAVLAAQVQCYGVAVSLAGMPGAVFETEEDVFYTRLTGAPTGTFTSGSVFGIKKTPVTCGRLVTPAA